MSEFYYVAPARFFAIHSNDLAEQLQRRETTHAIIDFRDCSWADLLPMMRLLVLIRPLTSAGCTIEVWFRRLLPEQPAGALHSIAQTLLREAERAGHFYYVWESMDLLRLMQESGARVMIDELRADGVGGQFEQAEYVPRVSTTQRVSSRFRSDKTVFPIVPVVRSDNLDLVMDQVRAWVGERARDTAFVTLADDFCRVVRELSENVSKHNSGLGGLQGFMAARYLPKLYYYEERAGTGDASSRIESLKMTPLFELVVVDTGHGIEQTYRHQLREAGIGLGPLQVVQRSLRKHTRVEDPKGQGLYQVCRSVQSVGGLLQVVSGSVQVVRSAPKADSKRLQSSDSDHLTWQSGTALSVLFSLKSTQPERKAVQQPQLFSGVDSPRCRIELVGSSLWSNPAGDPEELAEYLSDQVQTLQHDEVLAIDVLPTDYVSADDRQPARIDRLLQYLIEAIPDARMVDRLFISNCPDGLLESLVVDAQVRAYLTKLRKAILIQTDCGRLGALFPASINHPEEVFARLLDQGSARTVSSLFQEKTEGSHGLVAWRVAEKAALDGHVGFIDFSSALSAARAEQVDQLRGELVRRGHFRLPSGWHAEEYTDISALFETEETRRALADELLALIGRTSPDSLLTSTTPGVQLCTSVVGIGGRPNWVTVDHQSVYNQGTFSPVRCDGSQLRPGSRVLIVTDVISTGHLVRRLEAYAGSLGCEVVGRFAVVDARERADSNVHALVRVPTRRWVPVDCPRCRDHEALESPYGLSAWLPDGAARPLQNAEREVEFWDAVTSLDALRPHAGGKSEHLLYFVETEKLLADRRFQAQLRPALHEFADSVIDGIDALVCIASTESNGSVVLASLMHERLPGKPLYLVRCTSDRSFAISRTLKHRLGESCRLLLIDTGSNTGSTLIDVAAWLTGLGGTVAGAYVLLNRLSASRADTVCSAGGRAWPLGITQWFHLGIPPVQEQACPHCSEMLEVEQILRGSVSAPLREFAVRRGSELESNRTRTEPPARTSPDDEPIDRFADSQLVLRAILTHMVLGRGMSVSELIHKAENRWDSAVPAALVGVVRSLRLGAAHDPALSQVVPWLVQCVHDERLPSAARSEALVALSEAGIPEVLLDRDYFFGGEGVRPGLGFGAVLFAFRVLLEGYPESARTELLQKMSQPSIESNSNYSRRILAVMENAEQSVLGQKRIDEIRTSLSRAGESADTDAVVQEVSDLLGCPAGLLLLPGGELRTPLEVVALSKELSFGDRQSRFLSQPSLAEAVSEEVPMLLGPEELTPFRPNPSSALVVPLVYQTEVKGLLAVFDVVPDLDLLLQLGAVSPKLAKVMNDFDGALSRHRELRELQTTCFAVRHNCFPLTTPMTSMAGEGRLDADSVGWLARQVMYELDKVTGTATLSEHNQSVSLCETLRKVLPVLRFLVEDADMTFKFSVELDDADLELDGYALANVLIELVRNAVKYCNRADATITLDVPCLPSQKGVTLRVIDDGEGIPEHENQKVFELKFRSTSARVRKVRGTGAGLTLAREVVEKRLNGTLELLASSNGETVFEIVVAEGALK